MDGRQRGLPVSTKLVEATVDLVGDLLDLIGIFETRLRGFSDHPVVAIQATRAEQEPGQPAPEIHEHAQQEQAAHAYEHTFPEVPVHRVINVVLVRADKSDRYRRTFRRGSAWRRLTGVTRILFATDFHGIRPAYDDLVQAARQRRPDAVVLGGDLLPLASPADGAVEIQQRFVQEDLRTVFTDLRDLGCSVYAINGNDDWAAAVEDLKGLADDGLCEWIHGRAIALTDDWSIAGLGLVPVTPFYMCDFDRRDHDGWTPMIEPPAVMVSDRGDIQPSSLDEILARPTLDVELAALAKCSDPKRTVYVVHTPPFDCDLDRMHGDVHIGSVALRRFLETHQPPISLHGHIHESPKISGTFKDTVGVTRSFNPGACLFGFRGVWLDIEDPASAELIRESKG